MTLLTAGDVPNKKFQATKFREGYEQDEVDESLDEIVEAMCQLEAENTDLKAKLEAANRRVAQPGEGAVIPSAPASPVSPVQAEPAISMPAVSAGETGGQGPAAASGMLELTQHLHDEHVANSKAEGGRTVTRARFTGEQTIHEAEDQCDRTLAQLEKERVNLEHKIDELRRFESDYRTRLKSYLQSLLANVEDDGESSISSLRSCRGRDPPDRDRLPAYPREHLRERPTEPHHDGPHPIRMAPLYQSPVTRPPTKGGDPHESSPFAGHTAHSSPVLL